MRKLRVFDGLCRIGKGGVLYGKNRSEWLESLEKLVKVGSLATVR